MRDLINWIRFGQDLRGYKQWIAENLFTAQAIDGGIQLNLSYLALSCVVVLFVLRMKLRRPRKA